MGQPATSPRPIVVVLGSGRSGTSLLMHALAALGLRLSESLIGARRDNPHGYFEDAHIVRIHADLLRNLNAWPYHPLPADWLEAPATAQAYAALRGVLHDRLGRSQGLWGFKDPRTASFLPLWQRLCAAEGLQPRYILATREPGSILRSLMDTYGAAAETAEGVWLQRTCDALWHSRARCHIIHYEDWFIRAPQLSQGLARFTGLDAAGAAANAVDFIRPELNRSTASAASLRSPQARALHAALRDSRGDDFDRALLLTTAGACRGQQPAMHGASPAQSNSRR